MLCLWIGLSVLLDLTGISQLQVYIILTEWDTYNPVTFYVENVKKNE